MAGATVGPDVCRELAVYLTAAEAKEVADRLVAGQPPSMALGGMAFARRAGLRALCERAGLSISVGGPLVAVLRAVEGAHDVRGAVGTVWTAPDNLVQQGQLTASLHYAVERARESVVCSTFNFQRSSALWEVLAGAARRPELSVRVYLDTGAADRHPAASAPTTSEVAATLAGATVLRTRHRNGSLVRSHAKFVSVDHRFLVVTSANFSSSAEQHNIELGLVIDDAVVAQGIEGQMAAFENHLYEVVRRS